MMSGFGHDWSKIDQMDFNETFETSGMNIDILPTTDTKRPTGRGS